MLIRRLNAGLERGHLAFLFAPFLPHESWIFGRVLTRRLFWPVISTVARRSCLQRFRRWSDSSPLLPPSRFRVKLVTGTSGTVLKLVRRAPVLGADDAVEVDVDLAFEGGEDVGQLVPVAGGQVDRSFERLLEQRRDRLRGSHHRVGRAVVGGELDFGAGRADVAVVEEAATGGIVTTALAMFASPGAAVRVAFSAGFWARLFPPLQLQGELRPEGQLRAVGGLEGDRGIGLRALVAEDLGLHREAVAVGRVER